MASGNSDLTDRNILNLLIKTWSWHGLIQRIPGIKTDIYAMISASFTINILALALPVTMMQIYDRIIPNSSYSTLSWLITGVITAIILETILKIARSFTGNWMNARLEHILNSETLNYLLSSRLDRYEKDKAAVHLERFNSVKTVKQYLSGQIFPVLLDVPFAVIYLILLYYVGGYLVLFTLFNFILFFIITSISKGKFESYNEKNIELNKENLDFALETLGAIHTVKSMSMEERMIRKFENIQARLAETNLKSNRWKSFPTLTSQFFSQLNMMGIIFIGADLVIGGQLTVGSMTACTMLSSRGFQPFSRLAGFWLRFSEVISAQKQIKEILDLKSDEDTIDDIPIIKDIEGAVFFENFAISQESLNIEIKDFSIEIGAGEIVGITGENHELTSLLMLSVCGMYKPSNGEIYIDEFRISTMDLSFFGGRVQYIPRKGRLFNGSLLDNISLFDPSKRSVALDAAALLDLDKFVADLPSGYETIVDHRSNNSMPLGLIQRTCFARALVTCPRILILDRTLSSLDAETYDLACEILKSLKGKTTIFIVSDHGDFPFETDRHIECTPEKITVLKG